MSKLSLLLVALLALSCAACEEEGGSKDPRTMPPPKASHGDAGASTPADTGGSGIVDTGVEVARDVGVVASADNCGEGGCVPSGVRPILEVVFEVEIARGLSDANCQEIDPFRWAAEEDGRSMFLVGGVHPDTEICPEGEERLDCLSHGEPELYSALLGDWKPNTVEMYDDGTHGDAAAGDGVHTLSIHLPDLRGSGEGSEAPPLRLGYKYTWGTEGSGWTGSEEFPGNQRLLEVVDTDGDGKVLRRDYFGDETRNKDKANLRQRSRGGCGLVTWTEEAEPGCANDVRENGGVVESCE